MRTWGLKSLVDFADSMGYDPDKLIATLGLFVPNAREQDKMSELRIGLSPKNQRDHVICGVSWPVIPEELMRSQGLLATFLKAKVSAIS